MYSLGCTTWQFLPFAWLTVQLAMCLLLWGHTEDLPAHRLLLVPILPTFLYNLTETLVAGHRSHSLQPLIRTLKAVLLCSICPQLVVVSRIYLASLTSCHLFLAASSLSKWTWRTWFTAQTSVPSSIDPTLRPLCPLLLVAWYSLAIGRWVFTSTFRRSFYSLPLETNCCLTNRGFLL